MKRVNPLSAREEDNLGMSDAFSQNKTRSGKALSYCCINSTFAVVFGLAMFTLGKKECYTTKSSNTPVDPNLVPDAVDVNGWFNGAIVMGFFFYSLAAVASLGYMAKQPMIQAYATPVEKVARFLTYFVFILVHVIRLCHTGRVCSGDYLPDGASDEDVDGYMIAAGWFFMMYIVLGWIMVPLLLIIMVCIKGDAWAALALDAPK